MRNTIQRKMVETRVHGFRIDIAENGEPKVSAIAPVLTFGKVTHKEAEKLLRASAPEANSVTVAKIESAEAMYEIKVEDFISHAVRIEPTENKEEENE